MLDLANVGAGALVFGQALGAHEFSIGLAVLGTSWWLAGLGASMLLGWKGRR